MPLTLGLEYRDGERERGRHAHHHAPEPENGMGKPSPGDTVFSIDDDCVAGPHAAHVPEPAGADCRFSAKASIGQLVTQRLEVF